MDPEPAPPLPPPPLSARVQDRRSRRNGCLIALSCLGLAAGLMIGGCIFLYYEGVQTYTAAGASSLAGNPTPQEVRAAEQKLRELGDAAGRGEAREIFFTERDLNTLIARDPAFRGLKDRALVQIRSAVLSVETSIPRTEAKLPLLGGRWLNLTSSLLFDYKDGQFYFEMQSITANHEKIPTSFVRGFNRSFSKAFNEKFRERLNASPTGSRFWNQIESMRIEADKVIVRTKAATI